MVDTESIMKNIIIIVIVTMMLGVFSPYLFPDRRRTIIYLVPVPDSYVDIDLTIPYNFTVNIHNSMNISNNYKIDYVTLFNNKNATDTNYIISQTSRAFQSFFLPRNATLNSTSIDILAITNGNGLNFTVYNSSWDNINHRYMPSQMIHHLGYVTIPPVTHYQTCTLSNLNKSLDITKTLGNIFFFGWKLNSTGTSLTVRPLVNSTYHFGITCREVGGSFTFYNEDVKTNSTFILSNYTSYQIESDNATLNSVTIGSEIKNREVNRTESNINCLSIYNYTNTIPSTTYSDRFYTYTNLSLNLIQIVGNIDYLNNFYYATSNLSNFYSNTRFNQTLFDGLEILELGVNESYAIELISMDIYINSSVNNLFYTHIWNVYQTLHLRINSINFDVTILSHNFDYLF